MDVQGFELLVDAALKADCTTPFMEDDIKYVADKLMDVFPVTEMIYTQAIKNIKAKHNIVVDTGTVIEDHSQISWYPIRKAEIDPYYWTRYQKFLLEHNNWPDSIVKSIDRNTDEIMDLFGDPLRKIAFKRKGLIIGDVQSGKTATYIALCNKAADAGYKVIILLTGTIEALRRQTQERIDTGFVGRKSKEALHKDASSSYVGVGTIDNERVAMTFTSEISDFSEKVLNNLGLRLKDNKEPVVFVVKKNKKTLENLKNWLSIYNTDSSSTTINLPLLLLDDEADNASVNTKYESDPTTINYAIRNLISLFRKSTYVGVTATPFANIFIDPDAQKEMLGNDLFPSNFIYSLPTPSNYIGSMKIFGDDSKYNKCIKIIEDIDERTDEYLRFYQKKTYGLELVELPMSLQDAIYYFILVNAVQDYRGQTNQHRSMLINVSRLKIIHKRIAEMVSDFMRFVSSDVTLYHLLEDDEAMLSVHMYALHRVWRMNNMEQLTGIDWENIKRNYLLKATKPIEVRMINSSRDAKKLDYSEYANTGARIIAVGGNSLSRGLTLEGLSVSYFYRNTKMYDTLLQMGRWFGYRKGYDDLFRIHMTQCAVDWFEYITESTQELKSEIKRMNSYGASPNDFGLRIRQDVTALMITARNKMKHTKTMIRDVRIAGSFIETPRLNSDTNVILDNYKNAKKFIGKLSAGGYEEGNHKRTRLFTDVNRDEVVDFLRKFSVDSSNVAFNNAAFINYILSSEKLKLWDVVVPSGSGVYIDDFGVSSQIRAFTQIGETFLVNGKKVRVGSGGCTKIGLSSEQIQEAKEWFYETADQERKKKSLSDKAYLIEGRKPLLLVHVLEVRADSKVTIDYRKPLIALGIAFPRVAEQGELATTKYVINLVAVNNGIYEPEDESEGFYDIG